MSSFHCHCVLQVPSPKPVTWELRFQPRLCRVLMQYCIPSIKNVLSTYSVLGTGIRHWVPLLSESFSLFKAEPLSSFLFFLSFPPVCMCVCLCAYPSFQPNILLKGRRAIFFFKFYFVCLFGCIDLSYSTTQDLTPYRIFSMRHIDSLVVVLRLVAAKVCFIICIMWILVPQLGSNSKTFLHRGFFTHWEICGSHQPPTF